MKIIKRHNKEFETQTLLDIDFPEEVLEKYDNGEASASDFTLHADELHDMAELQKRLAPVNDLSTTYGFSNATESDGFLEKYQAYSDDFRGDYDISQPDAFSNAHNMAYSDNPDSDDTSEGDEDGFTLEELLESEPAPAPRPLTPDDDAYEDIMDKFKSAPTKPEFWFEEFGDYWTCSCGRLNKGDRCIGCGLERELLRSLFILHKPEDTDPESTDTQIPVKINTLAPAAPNNTSELSSKKTKLIISIILALLLILGAGFAAYKYILQPQLEAQNREKAASAADILEAAAPKISENYNNMKWQGFFDIGNSYLDNGQYRKALEFFAKAKAIKSTSELTSAINDAKFGYVKANRKVGGDKFLKYMEELMAIDYPGIQEIYDEFYAWHINIVSNTSEDDFSTDSSTFSRKDTVYVHVTLDGGKPDETLSLYYEATWPDGDSQIEALGSGWKSGGQITARFSYSVPLLAKEGQFTFSLYDKSTNKVLKTETFRFEK